MDNEMMKQIIQARASHSMKHGESPDRLVLDEIALLRLMGRGSRLFGMTVEGSTDDGLHNGTWVMHSKSGRSMGYFE